MLVAYIVLISRDVKRIVQIVRGQAEHFSDDLDGVREQIRNRGPILASLLSFFKRKSSKEKKKVVDES